MQIPPEGLTDHDDEENFDRGIVVTDLLFVYPEVQNVYQVV